MPLVRDQVRRWSAPGRRRTRRTPRRRVSVPRPGREPGGQPGRAATPRGQQRQPYPGGRAPVDGAVQRARRPRCPPTARRAPRPRRRPRDAAARRRPGPAGRGRRATDRRPRRRRRAARGRAPPRSPRSRPRRRLACGRRVRPSPPGTVTNARVPVPTSTRAERRRRRPGARTARPRPRAAARRRTAAPRRRRRGCTRAAAAACPPTSSLQTARMVGPRGGVQAPAATATAPSSSAGAPGRQVAAASTPSRTAYAQAIGRSARRGPYRSTRAALTGDRKTLAAPKSAMTVPATAYEPVARLTASIRDRETIPYDSRPSRAAAKVRRAWGMRSTRGVRGPR